MNWNNNEIIKINFEHLIDFEIPYGRKINLTVYLDNIPYNFILNLKNPKDNLLIIATEPEFSQFNRTTPYFEKKTWEFKHSTIFYIDPTYFIDESITTGFCIGTEDNYYLEKIIEILKILINKIEVINENIIFYGNNVGGFTSLLLSIYFKKSISISDNPKLYAYDFESNEIILNELEFNKKHCFSDMPKEKFIKIFNKRFSIIETIKQENYMPNSYLILNYNNYNSQLSQFFKELTKLKNLTYSNKLNLILNWDSNNTSINKHDTLNLINDIFLSTSSDNIKNKLNEQFSNNKKISNESIEKLLKYNTSRIDLKFDGNNDNKINILDLSDNTHANMPSWLNETGGEGIILLNAENCIDIKLRCIGTGNLLIKLRGVDFRDKFNNRIPIYINYTKFSVNGIELLDDDILTWHDKPFIYSENIEMSKILDIHIEWCAC